MNNFDNRNTSIPDSSKQKKPQMPPEPAIQSENHSISEQTTNSSNTKMQIAPQQKSTTNKPLKAFGGICIVLFILAILFGSTQSVNTSDGAKSALASKVSTTLSAGTILLTKDESSASHDYTITHQSDKKDTKIWVWDYAAEDGDYVQVLVNGTPVGEAFMIKHKPAEIMVPSVGQIQIKGIKDGGGGITYAVKYEINGTSYFNSAPEGTFNTYTLIKE